MGKMDGISKGILKRKRKEFETASKINHGIMGLILIITLYVKMALSKRIINFNELNAGNGLKA